MGSAGILIIFAVVNAAEAKTAGERGSKAWISITAAATCAPALAGLIAKSSLPSVSVFAAMVALSIGIEAAFRRASGRSLRIR